MIDTNALRKKVLDLAIRGKLVPQNPNDEPASVLLERIREEKQRLIREGKIKKDKVDSVIFRGDDNCHYEKIGNSEPVLLEDLPFEIPDSWSWVRLKTLCEVRNGATPRREVKEYWENGTVPWFTIEDKREQGLYITHTKQHITDIALSKDRIVPSDSVLLCCTASVGEVAYTTIPLTTNQQFNGLSVKDYCKDVLFSKFLLVFSFTLKEALNNKLATATTFNFVSVSKIENLLIPIPPLEEQKEIVNYIEEIFGVIDLLENEQADYINLVDVLRKSILQSAIRGTLVEQDETDEPVAVLLEKIRAEKKAQLGKKYVESYIYKGDDNRYYEHINGKSTDITENIPFELPTNWCWARWGDISESIQYGYNAPAKENGRIKMVRISDIQNGNVVWESVPYCDIDEEDIESYTLKAGDILFARTGGTVGKSYLVTEVPEEAIYAGYLIRTRYSNQLSSQYLKYFMETNLYWLQLTNGTTATAQPNCNGKTLGKMLLPIPPLAEQERIVNKINEIFAQL